MVDVLLDDAEDRFLRNDLKGAYNVAKLAQDLDPLFGSVDRYVAAFRVHAASLKWNESGEMDWYNVLGVEPTVPDEYITHRFCKIGKLIHPDNHVSAGAPGAYTLLSNAYLVLGDHHSRRAFHRRWGLLDPPTPTKRRLLEPLKAMEKKKMPPPPTMRETKKLPPPPPVKAMEKKKMAPPPTQVYRVAKRGGCSSGNSNFLLQKRRRTGFGGPPMVV